MGCAILRVPVLQEDAHKRNYVRVSSPEVQGVYRPFIHHDCLENQIRAVVGRVAGPVVKPTPEGIALMQKSADSLARTLPLTAANDLADMPARYSGSKRARYERALESVMIGGLFPKDAYLKMFVKGERVDGDAKVNPDPRAIQFRGAKYCVLLAAYLQPIEHFIYTTSCGSRGVPASRNIAKGLNSVERAELLAAKRLQFTSPVVFSLDASRFDKHVSAEHLKIEHSVYRKSNPDLFFADLLAMQIVNTVFSSLGLKYRVLGRRMSGDMNTACGNCLLMLIMLIAYADQILHLAKWDSLDDGDDCLLIVEAADAGRVMETLQVEFLKFGMEMKVEEPAHSLSRVVFCQACVIEYAPSRFKFVRDYRQVISKALTGVRHWTDPNYRRRVLLAIGTCELILNLATPVLQSFALAILRSVEGRDVVDLKYAPDGLRLRAARDLRSLGLDTAKLEARPILDCARESFAEAFGLSVGEQVDLEQRLDAWTFDVASTHHWGCEWDVRNWTALHSCAERCSL